MSPLRPVTALDSFSAKARGDRKDLGVYSPCIALTNKFILQSYFDTTNEMAILAQPQNAPIVPSTLKALDIDGYAVGLLPTSECPIAIEFKGAEAASSGASATMILKPGEVLRPAGGRFSGFSWGLPFGWLGGGVATLIVFTECEAIVRWPSESRELLFHRVRLPIVAPASVVAIASARFDWPIRFPWPKNYFTSTASPQFGQPSISVNPTRVRFIVRLSSATGVATAPSFRCLLGGFDDFAMKSDGTIDTTYIPFFDVTVPTYSNPAGMAAQTVGYPVIEFTSGPLLSGGDTAQVTLMDMDDGTDIAGVNVDILRYGKL